MDGDSDHEDWLELSLATNANSNPTPTPTSRTRSRRSTSSSSNSNNNTESNGGGGGETIEPPFPWATDRPAGLHTFSHLISVGLVSIDGDVVCRRCSHKDSVAYDLHSKFEEVGKFVIIRAHIMHDRAPPEWMSPNFSDCGRCGQPGTMRPVVADRNEKINWLFLFLGQALGICTLEQLKWFCKHTKNHRTGAKNRVLYSSYIAICRQLQPGGPFESLVCKN